MNHVVRRKVWRGLLPGRFGQQQLFWNHISARAAKASLPPEVWDSYFKFCIVRHPAGRVLSYWHHRYANRENGLDLNWLLRSEKLQKLNATGWHCYAEENVLLVDHIIHYEKMSEALGFLQERLGLPEPLALPRAKGAFRTDRRSYREVMSPEQLGLVSSAFSDEIGWWQQRGHSFD